MLEYRREMVLIEEGKVVENTKVKVLEIKISDRIIREIKGNIGQDSLENLSC